MFLLVMNTVTFRGGEITSKSELVAKCEHKDVLDVVITQTLRSAYETAFAEKNTDTLFNGYTIEDVEDMDEWLQTVEQEDSLVIHRDIIPSGTLDSEIVTYNIIEDKNYGGKCYE